MKKLFFVMVVGLALFLGACSSEDSTVEKNENESNRNEGEDTAQVENVYPLTGIETNVSVDNRIIGVMVNNHASARPQSGLSKADMVFEILAEGQITRFLALYQSELPNVVGPVRSAREYYFELANGYDSIYVYHGAADFVNDRIRDKGIHFLNGSAYDNDGYLFKRESFRKAPHNSYLQLGAVYDVAADQGYNTTAQYEPLEFLSEEEVVNLSGNQASHVKIVYSNKQTEIVEFFYDEASGKYSRSNDGEQTVELDTEDPILVDNVFIVETDHEVIDEAGRRAIDFESGGNAYLIQKGHVQEVQWENRDGRIIPVQNGEPVGFVPGKTWINVVPTDPGMQQSVIISNE